MKTIIFCLVAVAGVCVTEAAECHGKPSPDAKPNLNPIQTSPPVFVKSTKNGKLYTVGTGDDLIHLVHVWGKLLV